VRMVAWPFCNKRASARKKIKRLVCRVCWRVINQINSSNAISVAKPNTIEAAAAILLGLIIIGSAALSLSVSPCALTAPAACSALRKPAKVSCCRKKRKERERKKQSGASIVALFLFLLLLPNLCVHQRNKIYFLFST
jgi:hypothetical protein